ncbi:unnamed protein product [Choristocarpus tenellus]
MTTMRCQNFPSNSMWNKSVFSVCYEEPQKTSSSQHPQPPTPFPTQVKYSGNTQVYVEAGMVCSQVNSNFVSVKQEMCLNDGAETSKVGQKRRRLEKPSENKRTAKSVSFSGEDEILGTAQVYDRTSSTVSLPRTRTAVGGQGLGGPLKPGRCNLEGIWQRSHGFNWTAMLEISGIPKEDVPLQAARMQSSSVLHVIQHNDQYFHLTIRSDHGVEEQEFYIGAIPQTVLGTNSAIAAGMSWGRNGRSLDVNSIDYESGDRMTVSRQLTNGGHTLVQRYKATRGNTGEVVEALSIFRRMLAVPVSSLGVASGRFQHATGNNMRCYGPDQSLSNNYHGTAFRPV